MDISSARSPITSGPIIQDNRTTREDLLQGVVNLTSPNFPLAIGDATPSTSSDRLSPMDSGGGTDDDNVTGRPVSPFCFVESIRRLKSIKTIENVRKELGSRPGAEGAYTLADALKYAVLYGHLQYSAWLLGEHATAALDAPVCCPLLLTAVRLDRADMVEQLCRLSRQVKRVVPYVDSRGCASMENKRTALHVAAEMSSVTIATTLLQYGADHTAKDQFGLTPLDRILHALPAPHVNFNTVRLAVQLIKCLPSLSHRTHKAWVNLWSKNPSWAPRLALEYRELAPGPFSLTQMSMLKVRESIGYPRLPHAIMTLPVPHIMKNFINLE